MRRQTGAALLEWFSIGLMVVAVGFTIAYLALYSRERAQLPAGISIAGVPVGGLTREAALQQVVQAYSTPVELHYQDQTFYLDPAQVSFRLNTEAMLAIADTYRADNGFWTGFWNFLWRRPTVYQSVPLKAEHSAEQLRAFLTDVAARYDREPTAAIPIPDAVNFYPGAPGATLDVGASMGVVEAALQDPSNRRAQLTVRLAGAGRPTLAGLDALIRQYLRDKAFEGLVSLYMVDLQRGDELHLNLLNGEDLPTEPDIAYAGMSIMKITILTEVYRQLAGRPNEEVTKLITETMTLSGNDTANWLFDWIGDGDRDRGWRRTNQTIWTLGLANTFWGGYYDDIRAPGTLRTPANQRADINTLPDPWLQTTPTDIGALMVAIYQCSQGGGALLAQFPDQFAPVECQEMIDVMARNAVGPVLIAGGVPEGTKVAHKHGWDKIPPDTVGDVGIVYSPGGTYMLSVYVHQPEAIYWDVANPLVIGLSRAVYNYFNPPA